MICTAEELIVFPWNSNFDTDIESIDEQHGNLVALINELANATTRGAKKGDVVRVLDGLTAYTDYHFSFEESVWEPYFHDDPAYLEHEKSHHEFLDKIKGFRASVDSGTANEVVEEILQFLISWLIYHILDTDKRMAITVRAVDSGLSLEDAKLHADKQIEDSKLTIRSLHLLNEREEIRQLSEQLEASERREKNFTDSLVNSIPGLLYVLDAELRLIRWNDGFRKLLGYTDEELKNKPLLSFFNQDSCESVAQEIVNIKDFGSTQFEAEILRKDGSGGEFLLTGHRVNSPDGNYFTGVGIDISSQKAVENELLVNQNLFEEAQHVASIGHWSLDYSDNQLFWSDEIFRIFELSPDEFKPSYQSVLDAIHPADRHMVHRAFQRSVQTNAPFEVTHRLLMQDGRIKYLRQIGRTVYSGDDNPLHTVGNIQDVTKTVTAEMEVERQANELKKTLMSTVEGVAKALEARDPYTAGHQQRVAHISVKIAERLGLDEFRIEGIRLGASIHDLGKIAVPAELLTKPVRLSEAEYSVVRGHVEAGYEILKGISFPWPILEIIHQHHERLDGSGYPQGLKGDELCLEARIVAVADIFEAMSTSRPYRAALGVDAAIEQLLGNRGTAYDERVVNIMMQLIEEGEMDLIVETES